MAWLGLVLARLRDERASSAAFLLVVFVTAFLFSVSPRLYDTARQTALRSEVAAAPASHRGIELSREMRIPAGGRQATGGVVAMGASEEERLPAAIGPLIADRTHVIESPRWLPVEPILWTTAIVRIQEGIDERLRYVHGSPPAPASREPIEHGEAPTFEVALSVAAAEALGVDEQDIDAGRAMAFTSDPTDTLAPPGGARIDLRFSGIFEPAGSVADAYWFDDRSLIVPRIRAVSADDSYTDVAVALAPESYGALLSVAPAFPLSMRYAWRYLIDPERLEVDGLDALAADLRSMEGLYREGEVQTGDSTISALRSRLLPLIDAQSAMWRSAEVALVTAGIGPVGLAAGSVAFLAVLSAQRRTRLLRAAQARGASTAQMIAVTVVECLILAVPPAVLAAALAIVLVPAPPWEPTALAAAVVATATSLLLVAAVASRFLSSLRVRAGAATPRWMRQRRLVVEGLVVALAAGATYLLLERGIRGSTTEDGPASTDLLLAATPALVALAAGIVASRIFPWAVGFLARAAERRRDFVPVLALRRASREDGAVPILIVLVAAAMIAAFSAAMLAHLERATVDVAWHEVGTSYRIVAENGVLPEDFDVTGIEGVEATATGVRARGARTARGPAELLAVDADAYPAVVAGTPSDGGLPTAFSESAPAVAAIVSTSLVADQGVRLGEPFQVRLAGRPIELIAVQARTSFPTLPTDRPFIVASLSQLRTAHPEQALGVTDLLVRGSEQAGAALADAVSGVAGARLESRAARTAALRDAPVMLAVVAGVAASALMAGAYAILAVAAAIALRGSSRIVETAQLRTLGLTRADALRLSIAEHGAPTLTAFAVGSLVGVTMFALVRGSVGLAALLGTALEIPAQLEALHLVLLLAALLVVAAAGIAVGAAAERRANPSTEIRRGLDP